MINCCHSSAIRRITLPITFCDYYYYCYYYYYYHYYSSSPWLLSIRPGALGDLRPAAHTHPPTHTLEGRAYTTLSPPRIYALLAIKPTPSRKTDYGGRRRQDRYRPHGHKYHATPQPRITTTPSTPTAAPLPAKEARHYHITLNLNPPFGFPAQPFPPSTIPPPHAQLNSLVRSTINPPTKTPQHTPSTHHQPTITNAKH